VSVFKGFQRFRKLTAGNRLRAPKPGALPIALHLDGEKTYEIVVLTELVKIVVKPLLRG
jgi:hypothetical protein